jgi:hypothetical protein
MHDCVVPEVDPDDESALRYVVFHYRYDDQRHERRYVVVAAYDNEPEFMARIDALSDELRARADRGEGDPRETVSGAVRGPGSRRRAQEERWKARRIFSRYQRRSPPAGGERD